MPKENHTSLINADHKLIITVNGQSYQLLGRTAQIARVLINAQHEPVDPHTLIIAMGLNPPPISNCWTPERLTLYPYIGQLRKIIPGFLYSLNRGRGWRINRDQHPVIVFDSHA